MRYRPVWAVPAPSLRSSAGESSRTSAPVSKALSGGYVPLGALLASRQVFNSTFSSMERSVVHGSSFGGGDLAAAAGIATLTVIEREKLVERAARLGDLLLALTRPLVERFEIVREVRGLGLMWAIESARHRGRRRGAYGTQSSVANPVCSRRW